MTQARSLEELVDEARPLIAAAGSGSAARLARELGIGLRRATEVIAQFELEQAFGGSDAPDNRAEPPSASADAALRPGRRSRAIASAQLDHLEIGTLSFARCEGESVICPAERVRLILAAAEEYEPDLLVTAGHAVDTVEDLRALAAEYRELEFEGAIITEVLLDDPEADEDHTHAMWAVTSDGVLHRFGAQAFARSSEAADASRGDLARFEAQLPQRILALPGWNVFALICGEINIVQGRHDPRYLSEAAEAAIMAADVVINPTHDRMGNAGTLNAKRRLLSHSSEDGRNRVYISCSNWEVCGNAEGRKQYVSETLQTVYAAGKPMQGEQHADGSFGFVYRHWTLDL